MRRASLLPLVLALGLHPGCGDAPVDAEFESQWVEAFEADRADERAQEQEQAEVDALDAVDPLADVEDLEDLDDGAALDTTAPLRTKGAKIPPIVAKVGPISIFQDDTFFAGGTIDEVEARAREAHGLGAQVLRIAVPWSSVAPSPKALHKPARFEASRPEGYDFRALDARIRGARNAGLKVLLSLDAGDMPYWASDDAAECKRRVEEDDARTCAYRPNDKEYAKFVAAVGTYVKARGLPIWGWTFTFLPTVTPGDDPSAQPDPVDVGRLEALRYRRLWFAARRHLRVTAKVKRARVLFGDLAESPLSPGHAPSPSSPHGNLLPWTLCQQIDWSPSLVDGAYACPAEPRKVQATGVAFHAYGADPAAAILGAKATARLLDAAERDGALSSGRGLFVTEAGFPTRSTRGLAVSPAQQALYQNQLERALADEPRIRSVAQLRLVDEGDGAWETGLALATGAVVRRDGGRVAGELVEVVPGGHVVVRSGEGAPVTIAWDDVARLERTGAGARKPAYDAYRIAVSAQRSGGKVFVWGHARPDTGAGFSVEGLFPDGGGKTTSSWLEIAKVTTDRFGYGATTIDAGSATAWRLRFATDVSRTTTGDDGLPAVDVETHPRSLGAPALGPALFGVNTMGVAGAMGGFATTSGVALPAQTFGSIRFWDDTTSLRSLWCDLQPTADSDLEANLRARLDPKLDAAAAQGVRRVVLVVGHPAAWVYGGSSGKSTTGVPWFCDGAFSATALPGPALLGTAKSPGPAWVRFSSYVERLLRHVDAKYAHKLPFEVALQTWNEPSANSLDSRSGAPRSDGSVPVPGATQNVAEAADALARFDSIVRYHLDHLEGLDRAHWKLLLSPLTRYNAFAKAYARVAQKSHAASRDGVYDGVSVQTYSMQDRLDPKNAAYVPKRRALSQLLADYQRAVPNILDGLQNTAPALHALPVFQTETNHAFAVDGPGRALNELYGCSPAGGPCDRRTLFARLLVSALELEVAGQFLYTLGDPRQYPLHLSPTGERAAGPVEVDAVMLRTLATVRGWIVGKRSARCERTAGGQVWDCALRTADGKSVEHLVYAATKAKAGYRVPAGAKAWVSLDGETAVSAGAMVDVGLEPSLFR